MATNGATKAVPGGVRLARGAVIALGLALAAAGCRTESQEREDADADADTRALSVTYIEAAAQLVEDIEEAIATVRPKHAPRIAIEVQGTIERLLVDEGEAVEEGDLLAMIDDADYEIAHRHAQAEMRRLRVLIERKEREIERREQLSEGGHSPEVLLEEALSERAALREELAAARAEHEQARRDLDRTAVHAPYEGVIAARLVSEGDFAEAGTVVFEMTANSLLQVRVPLPESVAERLEKGLEVRLRHAGAPDRIHVGRLSQISPEVEGTSRAVTAIAEVNNPDGWRSGTSLNAAVVLEERESVVVPPESVVRRPAGAVVYVVSRNSVEEREVVIGRREADRIEILDGVRPGDRVVVHGAGFLSDGAVVDAEPHEARASTRDPAAGRRGEI